MRRSWRTLTAIVGVVSVAACSASCSSLVAGTATPDPTQPPTAVTGDGNGIIAGFPDAPVQLEIYTEPQCNHCADLQADFGDQIASYLDLGQLAVTYRPLTFYDNGPGGYSARVANALFLAASAPTSAIAFQAFVQDLWGHQEPGGPGPDNAAIAEMARHSGVDAAAVQQIASGERALDTTEMSATNFGLLYQIDPIATGTPTVYDLATGDKLDVYDDNWLAKVMSKS